MAGGGNGSHRPGAPAEEESSQQDRGVLKERPVWSKSDRNGDPPRDSRSSGSHRARGDRQDGESWGDSRQHKTHGSNDQENPFRRSGDRDNLREKKEYKSVGDSVKENTKNGGERSSWQTRNSEEPSWHKTDEKRETGHDFTMRQSRDWRDKPKEPRSWERAPKQELEPEWMDEPDSEEQKQTYTQDDFEQWKAKMKAGSAGKQFSTDTGGSEPTSPPSDANSKSARTSRPLVLSSGFDDFLSLGGQPNKEQAHAQNKEGLQQNEATGPKPSRASKFSSLFNPAPTVTGPPEPSTLVSPPINDTSAEDKAGFARILSLLGQQQQPQADNRASVIPKLSEKPANPVHSPSTSENQRGFDFLNQKSPPAAPLPSKDSEFLLNLMQKPRALQEMPQAFSENRRPYDGPGNLPFSKLGISSSEQKEPFAGVTHGASHTEMPYEDMKARDSSTPYAKTERRPPPGLPDMGRNTNIQRPIQSPGFPQGISRPPGLENYSAGFPPAVSRGPPPGFQQAAYRGGMPPPGLMHAMQQDRGLQFGPRPGATAMPPPSGFMTANGPPPGLPNLLFPQDGGPLGNYGDLSYNGNPFGQPLR